jgi:hypothetical protein
MRRAFGPFSPHFFYDTSGARRAIILFSDLGIVEHVSVERFNRPEGRTVVGIVPRPNAAAEKFRTAWVGRTRTALPQHAIQSSSRTCQPVHYTPMAWD